MAASSKHRRLIGENIRRYRKKARLTQERLAEKADLHPVYISQVECGHRAVTIDALLRLAKALGVRLTDMVDGL